MHAMVLQLSFREMARLCWVQGAKGHAFGKNKEILIADRVDWCQTDGGRGRHGCGVLTPSCPCFCPFLRPRQGDEAGSA
jgi:hypothetical protein